jgi:glycosyltransferase involved in cell wall biosynthesis
MSEPVSVLLATEGTYPYVMGGVSTWCAQLVDHLRDLDWKVFPVTPGSQSRRLCCPVPAHVEVLEGIRVWSDVPAWSRPHHGLRLPAELVERPARLAEALLGWDGDLDDAAVVLSDFQRRPGSLVVFGDGAAFRRFRETLCALTGDDQGPGSGIIDRWTAVGLFRTLGWVAATAAAPCPAVDVHLVTAAGWAALPAVVDRFRHGTPVVLAEHGVYVREAYLAAAQSVATPGTRWAMTRLARGLARLAYRHADTIAPVTSAHVPWERALGADPDRIVPVPNGIAAPVGPVPPPPRALRAVSVGRIDPLKDVHTLLEVAAEVVRRVPEARFVHHGPVSPGSEAYARACMAHRDRLRLGAAFRFLGPTSAPIAAVRDADVVVSTSISEGMPIALLEAMSQARPVVATGVGGVAEVVAGCGIVAPPGDIHRLADGVVTLLTRPDLAETLGARARRRVAANYSLDLFVERYGALLHARGRQVA